MPKKWNRTALILLGVSLAVVAASFLHHPTPIPAQEGTKPDPLAPPPPFGLAGSPSCSAASCHGGIVPLDRPTTSLNEFTLWSHRDPHTRAYQVLKEKKSLDIVALLKGEKNPRPWEEPVCLACHTNPLAASHPPKGPVQELERSFGVSCESCHGAAQNWLVEHTEPAWRKLTRDQKLARGMAPLDDPVALFHNCAGCHVGAPAQGDMPVRDVTHDLIAAGHPQMRFEPSTFLANLPPHWKTDPPRRQDRSAAQTWALGQVAAAEASLRLTRDRLSRDAWPELAEFSCFACHHDLQAPSWRQHRDDDLKEEKKLAGRVGQAPWSPWYWTGLLPLAETKPFAVPELEKEWQQLSLEIRFPPSPGKGKPDVAPLAKHLAHLRGKLSSSWEKTWSREILLHLVKTGSNKEMEWDQVEQFYLALYPLNEEVRSKTLDDELKKLIDMRAFQEGLSSPGPFHPRTFFSRLEGVLSKVAELKE